MSDPFIGEIKIVGFNFAPTGWATCDGQLLPIAQNTALFSLLGTMYGGDGRTTFQLPDLRGRFPMHQGSGPGLSSRSVGHDGGSENKTLTSSEMPVHSHNGTVIASTDEGDRSSPSGAYMARPEEPVQPYAGTTGDTMAGSSVQTYNTGGGLAHDIMPPFLVLNFVMALVGLYPSRS